MTEPTDISSPPSGAMSASEVLHLVSLFDNSLSKMEKRLVDKMDSNSDAARERWVRHDEDLARNRDAAIARFEKIEKSILTVETTLNAHLQRKHEEDVISQARVRPIKMSVAWLWAQRKDIILFAIFLMAAMAAAGEWLGKMFGIH